MVTWNKKKTTWAAVVLAILAGLAALAWFWNRQNTPDTGSKKKPDAEYGDLPFLPAGQ
jgi:hypothetical protein